MLDPQAGTSGNSESLLQETLTVPVGREKFEFRIPGLFDEIAIGTRIAEIRKRVDKGWNGFDQNLDGSTMYYLRAAATFELLLVRSTAKWAFAETPSGRVTVDSEKFPRDEVNTVMEAYQGFVEALNTFRARGNSAQASAGAEAVAAEPDTR